MLLFIPYVPSSRLPEPAALDTLRGYVVVALSCAFIVTPLEAVVSTVNASLVIDLLHLPLKYR